MNSRLLALACVLLTTVGCATKDPEPNKPGGKIGGGMSTHRSSTSARSEPGSDLLLSHEPGSGQPFKLGDTAAFDACTVLPMSAIREAGIALDPRMKVKTDFMERDAPGKPTQARMNLEGLSNCTWPGVKNQLVVLQIFQPPYSHDKDRTGRLSFLERKGAKEESIRGLRVYTNHGGNNDPKDWQVSLFADNYWALLLLQTKQDKYRAGSPQEVVAALTDRVAENLSRGPTSPAQFSFGGSYARVPDPCALFTRDDFRTMYGVDDVGRVTVGRSVGEQLLEGDPPERERANYIEVSCARKALGATFNDDGAPGLEVQFQVFPDAKQAALMEFGRCDPSSSGNIFGPPLPISTKIGDGRVCMPNENRDNRRLIFRAGNVVVGLHNWLYSDATDLNALATKLTPIAQTLAARLTG